jgi:predicted neutral ceramidase superfamily lipid hydrolase
MSTDLMGEAISLHFKLTSKLLPFPFSWDQQGKQLKYQKFTPRFIPWYFIAFVVLPFVVSICTGLLVYDIMQPQRIMNFFQLLFLIWAIVVSTASTICAASYIRCSDEWVSCFNQLFSLRNSFSKGS